MDPTPQLLTTPGSWEGVLDGAARASLEPALPRYLVGRRWFGGKARTIRRVEVLDSVPVPSPPRNARFALLRVSYAEGDPELYALPLAFASGARAAEVRRTLPGADVARLVAAGEDGLLYAAEREEGFARALLDAIGSGRRFAGLEGELVAWKTSAFAALGGDLSRLAPVPLSAEQSNTSIRFGDRAILKLFRRTEAGPNPDLEIGAFLTDVARFPHTPPVLGGLEYRPRRGEPTAVGILLAFVANEGDAWSFTLGAVATSFERLASGGGTPRAGPPAVGGILGLAAAPIPDAAVALVGPYLEAAALLGRRTAELHVALGSHPDVAAFAPEPFSAADRRELHEGIAELVARTFALLRRRAGAVPA
ncbi:MAG: maltokinase N-terminal cap-like domain-containing protein, partial [Anaeromyxobacteraceae bacterium]